MRILRSIGALALFGSMALPAFSAPVYRAGESFVRYTHSDEETTAPVLTENGDPNGVFFDNTFQFGSNGSTLARGSALHQESSTSATLRFNSNTGVSQTDPNNNTAHSSLSRLTMEFKTTWEILDDPFGPIIGSFSIPVAFVTGTGSGAFARFEYDIHWDRDPVSTSGAGDVQSDVRPAFIDFGSSGGGFEVGPGQNIIKTFTAPSAVFSPGTFNIGDKLILRGTIRFSVNNDDSTSSAFIQNPCVFRGEFEGCDTLFDVDGNPVGEALAGFAVGANPVPTPTAAAGGLALMGLLGARRRRRQA